MSVPQRFLASSVRGAMSEAKRALGPDALIIEHRLINGRVELLAMAGSSADSAGKTAISESVAAVADPEPAVPSGLPADADLDLIEEIELALPTVPESAVPDSLFAEAPRIAEAAATRVPAFDQPASVAGIGSPVAQPANATAAQAVPRAETAGLHQAQGDVVRVLESMGFSGAIQLLLSDQAVTPRLAINELVNRCRYSTWPRLSGLVPVIGGSGAGVTTSLLRLALQLRTTQPRLHLHSALSDTLAGHEKLLLGAQLLGLDGSRLAPDALQPAVAGQVPAELALLDLSAGAYPAYARSLRQLAQLRLLARLVLVVPLHWQPAAYLRELADIDLLWDRSCEVHLVFTGADRSAGIAPWLELAVRNDWFLCQVAGAGALNASPEAVSPALLRRLLRPQIDRPEASTIFTEELLRERGA